MKKKFITLTLTLLFAMSLVANPSFSQAQNSIENPQWYGIGSDWRILNTPTNLSIDELLNSWQQEIQTKIAKYNFNTVRLGFAFPDSNAQSRHEINFDELDQVLSLLEEKQIKAILDLHNYNDMEGYFGSPQWIQDWTNLAQRYKGDQRIGAYEIFNEPFGPGQNRVNTWYPTIAGSGSGVNDGSEGVATALADCVDAIRATGDSHTIIYPDPWWFRPTTNAVLHPETFVNSPLTRDNIVITMHMWFLQSDQSLQNTYDYINSRRAVMDAWNLYYPIWIGEFGAMSPSEYQWEPQKTFAIEILNYALSNNVGYNFWIARNTFQERTSTWDLIDQIMEASNYPIYRLQQTYDQLTTEYNKIQTIYNDLLNKHNNIITTQNELQNSYKNLQSSYSNLQSSYNQLQELTKKLNTTQPTTSPIPNNNLQSSYEQLQKQYADLNNSYSDLQKSYNELATQYNINSTGQQTSKPEINQPAIPTPTYVLGTITAILAIATLVLLTRLKKKN